MPNSERRLFGSIALSAEEAQKKKKNKFKLFDKLKRHKTAK